MASPTYASSGRRRPYPQRSRRSSFNGARQLQAAQAKSRRVLVLVCLLVAGLLAAAGTIVFHVLPG